MSRTNTHEDLSKVIARDGFVFLKSWHPNVPSEEVVNRAGKTLVFNTGTAVHCLVPKERAGRNTYSGIYGLNEFPFHTDMAHWTVPPRYLMLRCLRGHGDVATVLADSLNITKRADCECLSRALVKPRRPFKGAVQLLPLYSPKRSGRASLFRWDEKFIVPASLTGQQGMTAVKNALASVTATHVSLCDRGDTIFIDNWRMVHGRSAVAAEQADRVIERAYLEELY
jgi:alpha-ketoglutarate-dependent taurine dioxygenase